MKDAILVEKDPHVLTGVAYISTRFLCKSVLAGSEERFRLKVDSQLAIVNLGMKCKSDLYDFYVGPRVDFDISTFDVVYSAKDCNEDFLYKADDSSFSGYKFFNTDLTVSPYMYIHFVNRATVETGPLHIRLFYTQF